METIGHRTVARYAIKTVMVILLAVIAQPLPADETCQSPYMPKITGEEEYVYVWTLGVEGLGDGSDKLVTVDARRASSTLGRAGQVLGPPGRVTALNEKVWALNIPQFA